MDDVSIAEKDGRLVVVTPYNKDFVTGAHSLNGKWDGIRRAWLFDIELRENVEKLLLEVYGDDGKSTLKKYRITALKDLESRRDAVRIGKRAVCSACGRDSGVRMSDGASLLEGEVESGGSMKNWYTIVHAGAVFAVTLTERQASSGDPDLWKVEPFNPGLSRDEEAAQIRQQIARLRARLAELGFME